MLIRLTVLIVLFFGSFYSQAQTFSKSVAIKFLALGDSYTIGESVAEKDRWPEQLADGLRQKGFKVDNPRIIAVTGWRTDQLKKATEEAQLKNEYGLVSLLIGVNNQYQGKSAESYAPEFDELLEIALKLASGKKENVFVVSIPDYGYTPFGKAKQHEISTAIDQFNSVNRSVSLKKGIKYIDITDLTRQGLENTGYVAEDGLHPSAMMYSLWVNRMLPALSR